MKRAISATVSGRVHGVGFRYSTTTVAQQLGLHGWVRNVRDGTVELFAQGDADAIDQLAEFLHRGPPAARVDSVAVIDRNPDPALEGFRVSY